MTAALIAIVCLGIVLWVIAAVGLGLLIGSMIRNRDRQVPRS